MRPVPGAAQRPAGWSTGAPAISTLAQDALLLADGLPKALTELELSPSGIWLMGRSLGSVWAIRLASERPELAGVPVLGLIVESGIANIKQLPVAAPLIQVHTAGMSG